MGNAGSEELVYKKDETGWHYLGKDPRLLIIGHLGYIDLIRYRRVSKWWKKHIDELLDWFPSSKIYDGITTEKFKDLRHEHPHWFSILHEWSIDITILPEVHSEIKYLYPKKGNKARETILVNFLHELEKRHVQQFIKERVFMYNIIFNETIDWNAPIFNTDIGASNVCIIRSINVSNTEQDPGFALKTVLMKRYGQSTLCTDEELIGSGEQYNIRYMKLDDISIDYDIGEVITDGEWGWFGLDTTLALNSFKRCSTCAMANFFKSNSLAGYCRCFGDCICPDERPPQEFMNMIDLYQDNIEEQIDEFLENKPCRCLPYPAHYLLHYTTCICRPECSACTCEELSKDPNAWQYTDEHVGLFNGQHLIEYITFKTQDVFNKVSQISETPINWQTFNYNRTEIEKLKKIYEQYYNEAGISE